MTKRIFKYTFSAVTLFLPKGAEVILVGNQHGPTVWAIVNDLETQLEEYSIFGTGQSPPPAENHVGSVICNEFVWHVFKLEEKNGY